MSNGERVTPKERYSGNDFLNDLENAWGGKLYFSINPVFQDRLLDISSSGPSALREISERYKRMGIEVNVVPSGNLASDFKDVITFVSPHPEESRDHIHLLADPFCRGLLTEELENFFKSCVGREKSEPWVIDDSLPFALGGEKSVIFSSEPSFPTIEEYLIGTGAKGQDLVNQLGLTDEERRRFTEEFALAMDRFEQYIGFTRLNKHRDLHPFIRIVVGEALLRYSSLEKPLPPRRFDLPSPLPGMFQEVKAELDAAPEVFGRRIFSHIAAENSHLARAVADHIKQYPDEEMISVLNFFCVYYELFSRSARREGFSIIEVSDDLIAQYTDELKREIKFEIQQKGRKAGLTLFLSDEELTNKEKEESSELKQFWEWIDSIRQLYYTEYKPVAFGYTIGPLYYVRSLLYAQERENKFDERLKDL